MFRARNTISLLMMVTVAGAAVACDAAAAGDRAATAGSVRLDAPRESLLARAIRGKRSGDSTAPVTLLVVTDFQCPYCAAFSRKTLPRLDSLYVSAGIVRLIFVPVPAATRLNAWSAAEAAHCAGAAGQFRPMHDRLFADQAAWRTADRPEGLFVRYAEGLGIEGASFARCLTDDRMAPILVSEIGQIAAADIGVTPAFVLNGARTLIGNVPLDSFRVAIVEVLAARADSLAAAGKGARSSAPRSTGGL